MTVTVSKLCELPIFQEGFELVAGREGLTNNVQHVTVAEVPDFTDFDLGSQLFVLTTLYAYSDNLEHATNAVIKLCEKNISALAIKVNRFFDEIPASIKKVADDHSVPLFSVKKNVAFRAVINEISSEIIDSQLKTIKSLNQQHEDLMGLILEGDKLETFVKILGENLHCFCACLAFDKTILAQYTTAGFAENSNNMKDLIDKIDDLPEGVSTYAFIEEYMVFPCYVYNQTMGYLIIKPMNPIHDSEMLFVKQMISFMSIKFLEQHLKIETEQRMITAIVDQILFNRYADESFIQDRVKLLGLTPQKFHLIIILSSRQENRRDSLQFLYHHWNTKVRNVFLNSALFIKGSDLIAIVSLGDSSPYLQESAICRALTGFISGKNHKEESQVDFGFSLIENDLRQLPNCYEQAKKALKFGKAFKPSSRVFPYSEFIEEGLISHSLGSSEHEEIIKKILNPIKMYDEKYKAALWVTLEKCLFSKTLENAAQELHIHPSTLRYRIEKIADITRADFFSAHGRSLLKLSYVLSKIGSP
ncbi:MAG: regulator of polyketide synthase expression [Anaerosporomusa subterranea]|jgi:purine catabolism regulator|nr:regulator of polyketide synthase expression [Anaerosporomusa subterranea]